MSRPQIVSSVKKRVGALSRAFGKTRGIFGAGRIEAADFGQTETSRIRTGESNGRGEESA